MCSSLSFALVLAATLHSGLCIGTRFSPDNGSVVTHIIGTTDVMFECVVVNNGTQEVTQWNIENLRGVDGAQDLLSVLPNTTLEGEPTGMSFPSTFRTNLTFPVFLEDLHDTTLTCGFPTGSQETLRSGQFFLRVYREPPLLDLNAPLRFVEGDDRLTVNLEDTPPANPFPTMFQWAKGGVDLQSDSRRTLAYPNLTINDVRRSDSGLYSLMATNFVDGLELGTGSGSVTLDILFGPSLDSVPGEVTAVRSGDPVTLVCGTNLLSNPAPTVMWIDPLGAEAVRGRFNTIADNTGVRLEFTTTGAGDNGTWMCLVNVEGVNVTRPSGEVVSSLSIGNFTNSVNLIVVEAPSAPLNLSIDDVGATWVNMCWQTPSDEGYPGIISYTVTATPVGGAVSDTLTFTSSNTRLNATELLPNVEYEFRVAAVAMALGVGNTGRFSEVVNATTLTTVPDLSCDSAQELGGGIRVEWSFVHTGGVALSALTVRYQFMSEIRDGPPVSLDATTTDITPLVTNLEYTPIVEATNINGLTLVSCSSVTLMTGIPQDPEDPMLEERGGGDLRITVSTAASGIGTDDLDGAFYFLLFQRRTSLARQAAGDTVLVERMEVVDYVSGQDVSFEVEDLMVGTSYMFIVQAENRFGRSGNSSSSVTITGQGGSTSSNTGAIAGGVIGGLLAALLITIIVIIVIFILYKGSRSDFYKPAAVTSPTVKYSPAPTRVKVEEIQEGSPDIGNEISVELTTGPEKELHYAELENFRSPPTTSDPTSPEPAKPITQQVEPVQYAVIDSFKKAPSLEEKETGTSMV